MPREKSFEEHYQDNDTPWEINRPDHNLVDFVTRTGLSPGPAIDLGCGTGNNSIWLAAQGFRVTGCDLSELAIARAREKARLVGAGCAFLQVDFLQSLPTGAPFALAFDRGCFHTIEAEADRRRFAARVAEILAPGGQWLSLVGNLDQKREEGGKGPPQLSASQVLTAVEPSFELISLSRGHLDSNLAAPHLCWVCQWRSRR